MTTGMTPEEIQEYLTKLRGAERVLLATVDVPLSFMEEFYNLQSHIRLIEAKLEKALEEAKEVGGKEERQ
jgi:hypothetical protein